MLLGNDLQQGRLCGLLLFLGRTNTLHWCLDVTFREDESRVRERNLINNMAWLKRWNEDYLAQAPPSGSLAPAIDLAEQQLAKP